MSEKFNLKWNDYSSNWNTSLLKLRENNAFADVTLITDDKVKFSAHRILLSSCSNVFDFILKDSNQANSLLYLSGVSSTNLGFILDYIYKGGVYLYQEQLESFLESAKKLEIEGLLGCDNQDSMEDLRFRSDDNEGVNIEPFKETEANIFHGNEERRLANTDDSDHLKKRRQSVVRVPHNDIAKFDMGSVTPGEIGVKIEELYQKVDGVWRCLACNTTSNQRGNIKRHIETHLDGLSYTCNMCNKEFRSKSSLKEHNRKFHNYSNATPVNHVYF